MLRTRVDSFAEQKGQCQGAQKRACSDLLDETRIPNIKEHPKMLALIAVRDGCFGRWSQQDIAELGNAIVLAMSRAA